jgi:hypothetical protein
MQNKCHMMKLCAEVSNTEVGRVHYIHCCDSMSYFHYWVRLQYGTVQNRIIRLKENYSSTVTRVLSFCRE